MIIYPAIDLLDGKCVRLKQGLYDQVTRYSDQPEDVAQDFKSQGAKWIHIVDLNAAKTGVPTNHDIIGRIAANTGLKIQTGGGIRNMETLTRLIEDYGVSRCVLGTSAMRDRAFTEAALAKYANQIAIGIDAHDGDVAVDGWTNRSGIRATVFALQMKSLGAQIVIYTDFSRDGMLIGPATAQTAEMVAVTGMDVIASGGIGSPEDIIDIKKTGCVGVIVGKAIYEGKVRLSECMQNE